MGQAKRRWMRQSELQWHPSTDDPVCGDCLEDDALAAVVERHADETCCAFCGAESEDPIAVSLDVVTEHMAEMIDRRYTDPVDELPYESREGGYQGDWFDGRDLFEQIGYYPTNEALAEAIIDCFAQGMWCKADYYTLEECERLRLGWSAFCGFVKHERRFTFWSVGDPSGESEDHPDYLPVGTMLDELAGAVKEAGLIQRVPKTRDLWRVRVHKPGESVASASGLSSPPRDKAVQPNRMSPAGISMFYGASTYETACAETLDGGRAAGRLLTGGVFRPTRDLNVLDLYDLPDVPSFWDESAIEFRETVIFLRQFERDAAKPIDRGPSGNIEYVPTQAFSEYVRYQMTTEDGQPIDGMRYRSSKTGEACYVVFCEQEHCVESEDAYGPEQRLKLDEATLRTEKASDVSARLKTYRPGPKKGLLW